MKAAVYYETGPPSVFRYEDVADPVCRPKGVVVEVQAISIEGGDVLHRAGGEVESTPHVVGYQCAGVVAEVGEGVTERAAGQRVTLTVPWGSHAERVSVAAHGTWLVPEGMAIEEAACIPIPFGTADDCLFEFGGLQPGESVLVQGAGGGVGLAAVQLAKRHGATVLGTASSDAKLERLREFGLDAGINYAERDPVAEVQRVTDGRGVDVVVDPVGGATLQASLACLAYRGRAITVGNMSGGERRVDLEGLLRGNQSLTGVFLGAELGTPRVRDMIARHIEAVAAGELRVVIDKVFPLADAAAAHAYIESRQAFGRVVLRP